jgi:hypothetical protein
MAALGRKAGPMRHRLEPRGGARNEQADLLEEAYMEYDKESIELLSKLGSDILALIKDEHYDAAASFWPQSMSVQTLIGFAISCAERGEPFEAGEDWGGEE